MPPASARRPAGAALTLLLACLSLGPAGTNAPGGRPTPVVVVDAAGPLSWPIDNLARIGGHPVTVVGTPRVVAAAPGKAVEFNGATDGLFLEVNPIEGLARFTIEILFEPAADGPEEQRFLHVEEAGTGNRALVELRRLVDGTWCLDTYLRHGEAGLTLIDRTATHASGQWHVAALTYDGEVMRHYMNGVRELEGPVRFAPLGPGRTSIGVRQNRVSWFKGRIGLVRITPEALPAERLMTRPAAR